ncbi:hypothetical protein [Streptomyces sp. NBC_01207]|uniref:hypothetical protein n=1 Tax=Streptomyces sp. NBC_01207 TaxID=2903772 RepID=UPI002E13DCFC|nr:hypothetical protein OG457_27380 [Streptomyces sp. NBC_01207]
MNDAQRWELYRDADMRARLTGSKLRLTGNRRHWWMCARSRAGWSYGGALHVWAICSHRLRRPVGPGFVRAVQTQIRTRAAELRSRGH